jgi:HSP20 family protein
MAKGKDIEVSKGTLERMPRPLADIDRLFDEFFGRRWMRPFESGHRPFGTMLSSGPKVDVIDRDNELVVRAEMPGFRKEDVEIAVSGNLLTLKGESRTEEKEEEGDYYYSEISHEAFTRTLELPARVEEQKAKAAMKDGVLEVTLPKVEKSKRRNIAIE